MKNRGVILVALVITIIVLLILAGISIHLVLGENGLIKRAQESVNMHNEGSNNDIKSMDNAYDYMEPYFSENEVLLQEIQCIIMRK